jgi:hypothetical protein
MRRLTLHRAAQAPITNLSLRAMYPFNVSVGSVGPIQSKADP